MNRQARSQHIEQTLTKVARFLPFCTRFRFLELCVSARRSPYRQRALPNVEFPVRANTLNDAKQKVQLAPGGTALPRPKIFFLSAICCNQMQFGASRSAW